MGSSRRPSPKERTGARGIELVDGTEDDWKL